MGRHRIIESRGTNADSWFFQLDRKAGDLAVFVRYVAVENAHFYPPAPQPRGPVMIPRAAVTHDFVLDGRHLSLTICREPKYLLLDEIRDTENEKSPAASRPPGFL